jgi:hypothetical protein
MIRSEFATQISDSVCFVSAIPTELSLTKPRVFLGINLSIK